MSRNKDWKKLKQTTIKQKLNLHLISLSILNNKLDRFFRIYRKMKYFRVRCEPIYTARDIALLVHNLTYTF